LPSETTTNVRGAGRSIQDFRGDCGALARTVQTSWEENSQQALCYSAEFFESFLASPGANASLTPTLYRGDELIGFAAGFPRLVEYRSQSLQLVTNSFLSVLPEFKKSGLGVILWSELVKRIRAAGFDGMFNFCVDGEPMNGMIEGCCRLQKLRVCRIFSVRYMSALLKTGDFAVPTAPPLSPSLLTDFVDLAAKVVETQPLARKWTLKEAEWQCLHRTGAVAAHIANSSRRGILTGYVIPISSAERTNCLLVEDILWAELVPAERLELLQQFLSKAASLGARMATVPVLGYADLSPFKKLRFFPTRRVLHCYLTLFNEDFSIEKVPSMYLDVF
jgi:Acetyltransferase (GNAT) family